MAFVNVNVGMNANTAFAQVVNTGCFHVDVTFDGTVALLADRSVPALTYLVRKSTSDEDGFVIAHKAVTGEVMQMKVMWNGGAGVFTTPTTTGLQVYPTFAELLVAHGDVLAFPLPQVVVTP